MCVSLFLFQWPVVALEWKKKVKRINNATTLNTEVNLVCVNSARLTAWRAKGLLLPAMCSQELCKPPPDRLAVLPRL